MFRSIASYSAELLGLSLLVACGSPAGDDGGMEEDGSGTSTDATDTSGSDSGSGDGETGSDCPELGCECSDASTCDDGLVCEAGICSPAGSVPVPEGEFFRGCNDAVDDGCHDDELPGGLVFVSGFFVDVTEVTQVDYAECVDDGPCVAPDDSGTCVGAHTPGATPDHPARCITWEDAIAYCNWRGGRLPTEAEWEKAARGEDGIVYPWGDSPMASCELAVCDEGDEGCGTGDVMAVGGLPNGASPYGALDMLGNVAEWTSTWLGDDYVDDPGPDPVGPPTGQFRAQRGGGYVWPAADLRAARRSGAQPDVTSRGIGVRCVYDWP